MHGQNLDAYGFEVIQFPQQQPPTDWTPAPQEQNPSNQVPQQAPVYQNPQQPTQTQMFDNNGQAPVQSEDNDDLPF